MKNLSGLLFGMAIGMAVGFLGFLGFTIRERIERTSNEKLTPKHVCQTNIVNNGLDSWLADTNHSFGPKFAKRIFVMQLPTGKWHIRYRDETITNFVALFNSDQAFSSADEARQALAINMDLQMKKAVSDAMENVFK